MATSNDENIQDRVSRLGVEYRNGLIEQMAQVLDNRPTDGEKIGPQRELELWMMPTSPAAKIALQRGATPDEADQANAMWADAMRRQGAPEDLIAQTCRQFAYERGKVHARGDLERETRWHEQMAERAAAKQQQQQDPSYETMGGGEGAGDGGSY